MTKNYVIRQAQQSDLDAITVLEALCFPPKEAAAKAEFKERLRVYASHFWLIEKDQQIISMVNGIVSDKKDLADEMYHCVDWHMEHGKWQMIFGVTTHPQYQRQGYAAQLLSRVIEEARLQNRQGLVLTCKEHMLPYYGKFGFVNEGLSSSAHGDADWYQMRITL